MWRRIGTSSALLLLLCGCASTITALRNGPISSDHLEKPSDFNKLKTVSGDRRLVRVHRAGQPATDGYIICAETQADAIAARAGASSLTMNDRGAVSDAANESLLLTNQRGQVSDVVRQLAWHICNAELNGAYTGDKKGYRTRLDMLQNDAMAILMAMAKEPNSAALSSPTIAVKELKLELKAPNQLSPAPGMCKTKDGKACLPQE